MRLMMSSKLLVFVVFCSICSGCGQIYKTEFFSFDTVTLQVLIEKFKAQNDYHVLYGTLVYKSEKKIATVNLTCVSVQLDGIKDEGIHVDSLAHFMPKTYAAGGGGKEVTVKVYWVFRGSINEQSL